MLNNNNNTDFPDTETITQAQALERVTESVFELVGNPISTWAVAATLESLGIRDIDAKTDYGYSSVFDLGKAVYENIKAKLAELEEEQDESSKEFHFGGFRQTLKMFFKYYTAGMIFSMPMLSQIIAILIFDYALWAWFDFHEAQATVVALGTILAFVLTGGFIQSLGRLISKFKGEENYYLASKATISVLKVAVPFILMAALVIIFINFIMPFYPFQLLILSLIYMILISFLLLSAAVLFAIGQRSVILTSIVLGTLVVIIGMDFAGLGIYFSQWIGIIIATALISIYSILYYRLKMRSLRQDLFKQSLPAVEVSYYNTYRYFVYGFCYFTFLFMDRLLAWSAGPPPPEFIIWFNTAYELGMDWALISLVITIAMLEFSIQSFSINLIPAQKEVFLSKIKRFRKFYHRFYFKQILLLLVVGTLSILVTYYGVLSLRAFEHKIPEIADFFANPITFKVFWLASIGYLLLIYGLLNSLFFFTLNRPELVMYSMIGSLFVNFIVGFLCSRIFGLEYATIGLIAGSLVFAISTGVLSRRFFKDLDYYYYSAY